MSDCSTHAFDVPLRECPFCGSGWLYETRRNGYCDETPTMFCNSCKAVVTWEQVEEEGVNDETKAFVREHWNSRAERTCHIEWRDDSHDTDAGYERDGAYFCTACGADLPYPLQECWDDYQAGNYEKPFNYCPSCGCKVVGE